MFASSLLFIKLSDGLAYQEKFSDRTRLTFAKNSKYGNFVFGSTFSKPSKDNALSVNSYE